MTKTTASSTPDAALSAPVQPSRQATARPYVSGHELGLPPAWKGNALSRSELNPQQTRASCTRRTASPSWARYILDQALSTRQALVPEGAARSDSRVARTTAPTAWRTCKSSGSRRILPLSFLLGRRGMYRVAALARLMAGARAEKMVRTAGRGSERAVALACVILGSQRDFGQ